MTTITDLYARRAETWNRAKAFLNERRNTETGCLSAEDDAAYAKMEAEIEALSNEIARSERAEQMEANPAKATRAPITATPGTSPDEDSKAKPARATASYKRAFWDAMRLNTSPMEVRNA
ncbi:MAG: phage major capsid protein, partial [Actinomyces sp.]|nr:phage major capsid protein [Actinomyces sp.]